MCNSGYIVVKYLIAISGEFLVSAAPRMISNQTMVYLIPVIGWDLLVFCYFAMLPEVAKAYDSPG
jgi:hypothetical protein